MSDKLIEEQAYKFMETMYRISKRSQSPECQGKEHKHEKNFHGLKGRDVMFLRSIHMMGRDQMVKMSQLSKFFGISPAAVSQIMRRLEDKKLVDRVVKDDDRRSVYIKLSDLALRDMKRKDDFFTNRIGEILTYLGPEDSADLIRIFKRIEEFIDDEKYKGDII